MAASVWAELVYSWLFFSAICCIIVYYIHRDSK